MFVCDGVFFGCLRVLLSVIILSMCIVMIMFRVCVFRLLRMFMSVLCLIIIMFVVRSIRVVFLRVVLVYCWVVVSY